MENTLQNIEKFKSSSDPEIKASPSYKSNQGDYVFWTVDVKELFNIDLSYPGIKSALNAAFMESKQYVPVDTGLTKRSMTMRELSSTRVEVFFDPDKIIGKTRKGVTIKENYTIYIAESPKRYNWIAICMKHFYDELFQQVKGLIQKAKKQNKEESKQPNTETFKMFMTAFMVSYKQKKQEAKILRDKVLEEKKLLAEQVKEKKRLLRLKNEKL